MGATGCRISPYYGLVTSEELIAVDQPPILPGCYDVNAPFFWLLGLCGGCRPYASRAFWNIHARTMMIDGVKANRTSARTRRRAFRTKVVAATSRIAALTRAPMRLCGQIDSRRVLRRRHFNLPFLLRRQTVVCSSRLAGWCPASHKCATSDGRFRKATSPC